MSHRWCRLQCCLLLVVVVLWLSFTPRLVKSGGKDDDDPPETDVTVQLPFVFSYFGASYTFIKIYTAGFVQLNASSTNRIDVSIQGLTTSSTTINRGVLSSASDFNNCSAIVSAQFSLNNTFKFVPTTGYRITWTQGTTFTGRLVLITDRVYSFFIINIDRNQANRTTRFLYTSGASPNMTMALGQSYVFHSSQRPIGENYTVQCDSNYLIANTTTATCRLTCFNTNMSYFDTIRVNFFFCDKNITLSRALTFINQTVLLLFEISCDTIGPKPLRIWNLNTGDLVVSRGLIVYQDVTAIGEFSHIVKFVNETSYLITLLNNGPTLNASLSYAFCSTAETILIPLFQMGSSFSYKINLTCDEAGSRNLLVQFDSDVYSKVLYDQDVLLYSRISGFLSYGLAGDSILSTSSCQVNVPLGFCFPYFGNTYTTVSVCANGQLLLNNTQARVALNQGDDDDGDSTTTTMSEGFVSYSTNLTQNMSLWSELQVCVSKYYSDNSMFSIKLTSGFVATWHHKDGSSSMSGQIFLATDGYFSFLGLVFGKIDEAVVDYTYSSFAYDQLASEVHTFQGSEITSNIQQPGYFVFKASGNEESYSVSCDTIYYIINQPVRCLAHITDIKSVYFGQITMIYTLGDQSYRFQQSTTNSNQLDAPINGTSSTVGVYILQVLNGNLATNNTVWTKNLVFYPTLSVECNFQDLILTTLDTLICQMWATSNPNGVITKLRICYNDNSSSDCNDTRKLSQTATELVKTYSKPGKFIFTVYSLQPDNTLLTFYNRTVQVLAKNSHNLTCAQTRVVANSFLACNVSLFYLGEMNLTLVGFESASENISIPWADEMTAWSTSRSFRAPPIPGNHTLRLIGPEGELVSSFNVTVFIVTTTTASPGELTTTRLVPVIIPPKPTTIKTDLPLADSGQLMGLLNNYTGDLSDCLINCTNNGDCLYNTTSKLFECSCFSYYAGSGCKSSLDPCSSSPCLNNGTCGVFAVDGDLDNLVYQCECDSDSLYKGANCHEKIDLCANVTCSGNGNCRENATTRDTYCECHYLFTGVNCEIESGQMKTVKSVVTTTSVIAIAILLSFYALALVVDLTKVFGCGASASSSSSIAPTEQYNYLQ